jgi:hypothetical protein
MGEHDQYDENLDWDAWVDDAFQDYQNAQPPKGSSNHLPAKLPKTKKTRKVSTSKRYQIPIDWDYETGNKAEEMKEELRRLQEEKMLRRAEQAKKISWKEISKNTEYEVLVGGTSVGRVRQGFQGKWKLYPSFRWKKDSYNRHTIVETDYCDFHDSGRALVDLWTIS